MSSSPSAIRRRSAAKQGTTLPVVVFGIERCTDLGALGGETRQTEKAARHQDRAALPSTADVPTGY
jgi:hypothetical protein